MAVNIRQPTPQDPLSLDELDLYHAIAAYRAGHGLAAIPLSRGLTTTAGRHVADTRENIWAAGVTLPPGANLHSWSDAYYYSDHRDPSVMWTAPQRVNSGYGSAGYEISAAGFADGDLALEGWKASPSHDAILTQSGAWEGIELRAIGIGLDTSPGAGIYRGRVFHVWFGERADASIPDIVGTDGADVATGTAFADRFYAVAGADEIRGDGGDDTILGALGADRLFGEAGDDVLVGGAGQDQLTGGPGDDRLNGGPQADRLKGGEGDDVLDGGDGPDVLGGGLGRDTLTGGGGRDVFVFAGVVESPATGGRTTIADFRPDIDRIDVSAIDAAPETPRDDPFVFIGTAGFTGVAGQARAGASVIALDVDGDRLADMQIFVDEPGRLDAADFIL